MDQEGLSIFKNIDIILVSNKLDLFEIKEDKKEENFVEGAFVEGNNVVVIDCKIENFVVNVKNTVVMYLKLQGNFVNVAPFKKVEVGNVDDVEKSIDLGIDPNSKVNVHTGELIELDKENLKIIKTEKGKDTAPNVHLEIIPEN